MQSEKSPYFSVVMPVYGVEKYIKNAMKSVLNQTFTDLELIMVNDCTPDKSMEIAEAYAKEDERIKIVHHEKNQGAGMTRNTGTKYAKGKYIWYMDPDDYVVKDILEKVYDSLQKNPAQLVVFGLYEEYFEKSGEFSYRHELIPKEKYYRSSEELRKDIIYLEQQTLYGYPWNKVYDLEYLKSLQLEYGTETLLEDSIFNIQYCMEIETMNTLAIPAYHYGKRLENNQTNKFVPEYYEVHERKIEMLYRQYEHWGMLTLEVREILGALYARYIFSAIQRNCDKRAKMSYGKRKAWCKEVFQKQLFKELIPYGKAKESKSLQVLLVLLKKRMVNGSLIMGSIIYVVCTKMPILYSRVKSGR